MCLNVNFSVNLLSEPIVFFVLFSFWAYNRLCSGVYSHPALCSMITAAVSLGIMQGFRISYWGKQGNVLTPGLSLLTLKLFETVLSYLGLCWGSGVFCSYSLVEAADLTFHCFLPADGTVIKDQHCCLHGA